MDFLLPASLLVLSPLIGGLLEGTFRKLNARMQNRVGPPIVQPFYDLFKLLQKRPILINNYHVIMAYAHLVAMVMALATFLLGGDFLLVIFFHGMSLALLSMGAYGVRSSYSQVGATRELLHILAVEPVLIMIAANLYLNTGTFLLSEIFNSNFLFKSMPLAFLALVAVLPAKLKKSPFDVSEAHQEIIGGPEIEYSGPFYAPIYLAKWLEEVLSAGLIAMFFLGNPVITLIAISVTFTFVLAVDNSTARLSYWDMVKYTWEISIPLVLVNLVLNYIGVL